MTKPQLRPAPFRVFALALVAGAFLSVAGQATAQAAPTAADGPYVIRTVDFQVSGKTLDFVLAGKVDIKTGTSFPSKDALEFYIGDKRQVLLNERVLASVEASYDAKPTAGGGYDVAVHFAVKDSWNIIALPYFKYDSNSGLLLSARGRDYNFLGSMQTLSLNLNYTRDEALRSGFGISTGFTLPFLALDHQWSLGISEAFAYYPDGTPNTSTTSVSLGVTFKELGFPVNLSFTQGFNMNPDGDNDDPDPYYISESASIGATIPTGVIAGSLGELSYSPSASYSYNWRFGDGLYYDSRQGPTLSLYHSLNWGRVDWLGNQRQGVAISLSNSNTFYQPTETWTSYLDLGLRGYTNWQKRIGIASRFQAYARLTGGTRTSQGGSLRGIMDDRVSGEDGAFVNLDIPTKLFDFPTHLVIKKNWLDFEFQVNPFLDLGVAKPLGGAISSKTVWYSGGLEFLVFPVVMRSFIVRASIGFDLDAVLTNKSLTANTWDGYRPYELFFGIGLQY